MIIGLRFCLLGILILLASSAKSAGRDVYVPDELKPWQAWVLDGKEYRDCPFFFNRVAGAEADFVCAWPGRLTLNVDASGGRFAQQWTIHSTDEWIPLPGDTSFWPQQVTVNGEHFAVVARGDQPSIRLSPGSYNVSGRFEWGERPRTLRVPAQSGLLDLNIDGEPVARPDRNGSSVWLGEREQEQKAEDALQVQVYRMVADDVPTLLITYLKLEVSGSVREELIGPALPAGFTPLAIESELPARLEPDGNLRLQVRPGSWELRLMARAANVVADLTLPEPEFNLPTTEIWSYRSNEELRVTVPEGLAPVDPLQVDVPEGWEELPAYRVLPGDTLTISERSRGKIAVENQLSLSRELWLDFNGDGLVFSDDIDGSMRSEWRFDMQRPYELQSATENGENLLVTTGAADGLTGVEVRQPGVDLQALGRTMSGASIPVTGWQASFSNVSAILHLPPGNKLLAAVGADRSSMNWLNQWKLLDFFLVLIISISAARLFGRDAGIVSLIALTLSLHEPGAPAFIWLNLLVAAGLARVAPTGRLLQMSSAYRNLSLIALLVIFIPFAADQVRVAIYPQLESQENSSFFVRFQRARQMDLFGAGDPKAFENPPAMRTVDQAPRRMSQESMLEEIVVTASRSQRSFSRYAPNAIVQVGPGRPAWQWNSYRLNWSGPIEPDHSMRLVVMPRWLVTILRFIEVLLLGVLVAVFAFEVFGRRPPWFRLRKSKTRLTPPIASLVAAGILTSAVLISASPVQADTPSATILKQLEQRLLEPPTCVPRCAEIIEATVAIGSDDMTVNLTAESLENVALPLPGSLQGWRPEQVLIDNTPVSQIYRSTDQTLWIRTPEGRRVITLHGPLPPVDSLEIPFPTPPRVIDVETSDWFVAGIEEQRLLSGSLQLTRLQQQDTADSSARWESSRFPVFARVERTVNLDLDWRATTTVYRVAPEQGAITINVPLLTDEAVITEGFTVTDGEILVSMNPAQNSVSWQSTLPRQSPLILQAGVDVPWKEVWRFAIGSIWHADFDGVPESESGARTLNYRVAQFFPRPGESLDIGLGRPTATSGDTLVFNEVRISSIVGERSKTSSLDLTYRSTRGAQHAIRLPQTSEVISVVIDDSVAPLRAENGDLQLPILPGVHHISIEWRNDSPVTFHQEVPNVDLGANASNIHASITLPPNRWVLGTFGPKLGPSVLYWSELIILILIATILGRMKQLTPLDTRQWLLLGLGFSTFSWFALGLIVVWLLATGARGRWQEGLSRRQYNGVQVIFAVLSLAALMTIVMSLPSGLLGSPDMHVAGNGSYGNSLRWFSDRSDSVLPEAFVLSVPIWIYKTLILAWALWLSFALLRWLPWVWKQFLVGGLWRSRDKPEAVVSDSV